MISRTVNLGILFPTGISDLTKVFRNSVEIDNPYEGSTREGLRGMFQDLVYTLEDNPVRAKKSQSGPKAPDLSRLVNIIGQITLRGQGIEVPDNLNCLKLAYFLYPHLDGFEFNYGVMTHHGENTPGEEFPIEFGVLVPSRDSRHSAFVVSNNVQLYDYDKKMEQIADVVQFARKYLKSSQT